MKDLKFLAYSTKTGAYCIFFTTTTTLIINVVALFINRKSTYRCTCFKIFVTSVLLSTCMASLLCSICNIVLVFIVYGVSPPWVTDLYRTLTLFSIYTEYVSVIHILLISFQRYIAVVFPFKLNHLWILCNAKAVVAFIWVSLLVAFISLSLVDLCTQHKVNDTLKQIQSIITICVIPVLVFYYTKIVYTLVQRIRNVKLSTTSASVRGAVISLALGFAFVLAFLPRAIRLLAFPGDESVWTIYIYIFSYAFDSLLIIFKYVAEKRVTRDNKNNSVTKISEINSEV